MAKGIQLFKKIGQRGGKDKPEQTAQQRLTETYADFIQKNTLQYPDYEEIDRPNPHLDDEILPMRYQQGKGGYFRRESASSQDPAVMLFTGDLMCRAGQQKDALAKHGEYRFDESYSEVKDIFAKADFVTGNPETTLCARSPYMSEVGRVDGKPHDNAPPTYLAALRYAGFDMLAMANNHNCDSGAYGILDTLDNVNEYGFIHTGTFSPEDKQRFTLVEVNGIKIAIMAFATYYNDKDKMMTEEGRSVLLNKYGRKRLQLNVRQARKKGAEFIIAYNHWGVEGTHEVNEKQQTRAKAMADAGVDYIIGSHPHALQRYDRITSEDGRTVPVVYSTGNFLSNMPKDITRYTMILRLVLGRDQRGKVEIKEESYFPCYMFEDFEGKKHVTVPLVSENKERIEPDFYEKARERIERVMGKELPIINSLEE